MAGSDDEDDEPKESKLSSKARRKLQNLTSDDDDFDDDDDESCSSTGTDTDATSSSRVNNGGAISLEADMQNVMRLQKTIQSLQRQLDRERSSKTSAENKRQSLDTDNVNLTHKMKTLTDEKFALENIKIELESQLKHLQLNYNVESERKKGGDLLIIQLREQLLRKDDQYKESMEKIQQSEMKARSLQVQLQSTKGSLNQLEIDKEELLQRLNQEKTAWLIHGEGGEMQKKSNSLNTSNSQVPGDEIKAAVKLKTDELEKELLATKLELSKQEAASRDEREQLLMDNKKLELMNEKFRKNLELDEETLSQTIGQYNTQLNGLETENAKLKASSTEHEKCSHQLEDYKKQLTDTKLELDKSERKKNELERLLQNDSKTVQELLEQRNKELQLTKECNQELTRKLDEKEAKLLNTEKELTTVQFNLDERVKELEAVNDDTEDHISRQDKLHDQLRKEKGENVRLQSQMELLEDKVSELQDEATSLRQQLNAANQRSKEAEQVNAVMSAFKTDQDAAVEEMQRKNRVLDEKLAELTGEVESNERKQSALNRDLQQAKTQLADTKQELADCKATADSASQRMEDLKLERDNLKNKVDYVTGELKDTKNEHNTVDGRLFEMTQRLQKAEKELQDSEKKLRLKNEEMANVLNQMEINNMKLKDVVAEQQIMEETKQQLMQRLEAANKAGLLTPEDNNEKRSSSNLLNRHNEHKPSTDDFLSSEEIDSAKRLQQKYKRKNEGQEKYDADTEGLNEVEKQINALKAQLRSAKKQLQSGSLHSDDRDNLKRHARYLMTELQNLRRMDTARQHLNTSKQHKGSVGGDTIAEIEARIQMELNKKLAAINTYLQEHADACEKIDRLRESSDVSIRNDIDSIQKELQVELARIREAEEMQKSERESSARWKQDRETKERDDSAASLTLKDLCYASTQTTGALNLSDLQQTIPQDGRTSFLADVNIQTWSMSDSKAGLPLNLQQELDRSIAKHLEKAPQLDLVSRDDAGVLDKSAVEYMSMMKRHYILA